MKTFFEKLNLEDIGQIVIGAAVMAVPIAFTEELWSLGETLPFINLLCIFIVSVMIQGLYTYSSIFQSVEKKISHIVFRVIINYLLTLLTVAVILFLLNKISFSNYVIVGLNRILILSFPASLGAVIVDGFDKE